MQILSESVVVNMKISLSKSAKIVLFSLIGVIALGVGLYLEMGVSMPFEIKTVPEITERPEGEKFAISYDSEGRLDINMATAEELDTLKGIGMSTAEKIIKYREEKGPFDSVEELRNVSGIGEETINEIRDSICVR